MLLTSEYVLGQQYDVWDAHTSDGRWWVITNPVNLYSQDQIKSMDIALSFHIGLMSRMMASQPPGSPCYRSPGTPTPNGSSPSSPAATARSPST